MKLLTIMFLVYFGDVEYHEGTIVYATMTDLNQPLEAPTEPLRETYFESYEITIARKYIQFRIDNKVYVEPIIKFEKNGPNTIYQTTHWKVKVIEDFKATIVWWESGLTTVFTHPESERIYLRNLKPLGP